MPKKVEKWICSITGKVFDTEKQAKISEENYKPSEFKERLKRIFPSWINGLDGKEVLHCPGCKKPMISFDVSFYGHNDCESKIVHEEQDFVMINKKRWCYGCVEKLMNEIEAGRRVLEMKEYNRKCQEEPDFCPHISRALNQDCLDCGMNAEEIEKEINNVKQKRM
jgi:hypothetical protein